MSKLKKFWNFIATSAQNAERELFFNGEIAEETWWGDEVTPKMFRDELEAGSGPITVWINSPGGDCIAASQIYTMLIDYKGTVTVKINGLAASAASVIAMAGDKVLMSPTAMMMIHNPLTIAMGDSEEMQKAIDLLAETKESIINAYEIKTGLSRTRIAHLMDAETWMSAGKAVELGFADEILARSLQETEENITSDFTFSRRAVTNSLMGKLISKRPAPPEKEPKKNRSTEPLYRRLDLLKF